MKSILLLLIAVLLLAACSSDVYVRKPPGLDLSRFRRIFVEQRLNENRHLNEMMVDELRKLGLEASTGPLTMMPDNADAVLTYNARWTGDFRTSLLDLQLELHTARTNKKLSDAGYFQPTVRPKPPETVVQELIMRMFGRGAEPKH